MFTSDDADAVGIKSGEKIQLAKGDTTIYVRTYESLSDYRSAKDNDKDVRICKQEYKINVRKLKGSSYEDDKQDPIYLDNIKLNKGTISFFKQRTSYDVKVDSSIDEIKITAKPESDNDRVRINGDLADSSDDYQRTVSLDRGKNEIKIKVTDNKDNQRVYTLNVTRGNASDSQSNIKLSNLTLSEGNIDFKEDDTAYTVDLDESIDRVTIGAEPEDEGYLVKIDGENVNSKDDFEREVSLSKGKNTIAVLVEDELNDKNRTYTLTLNRGKAVEEKKTTESTNTTAKENTNTNAAQANTKTQSDTKKGSWAETSAGWQYNDENGNKKIDWVQDGNDWYYLGKDGIMKTGWVTIGSDRYYLNPDSDGTKGAMKVGWTVVDDKWYYLNPNSDGTKGAMKTGWIVDSNSKYYLDTNGVMATGEKTIEGKDYKFTKSGALII